MCDCIPDDYLGLVGTACPMCCSLNTYLAINELIGHENGEIILLWCANCNRHFRATCTLEIEEC